MDIKMLKFKNKLTVELDGKLDANSAPELEAKIEPELKTTDILIFDMQKLTYISSAGLRVLVFALQTLDAHGGAMKIENASEDVKQVFSLMGLLKVFDIK